jgi:hypothetical protein
MTWGIASLIVAAVLGVQVFAAPVQQTELTRDAFDVRADLELAADQVFGSTRPPGWTGNNDPAAPSFITDLWTDTQIVADSVYGIGVRPPEWFGVTVPVAAILVRNVRHDLELIGDQVFEPGSRPQEWRGARIPYIVCDRTLQNTLALIDEFYGVESQAPRSALNYCATVRAEIEDELIEIVFSTPAAGGVFDPFQSIITVRADLDLLVDTVIGARPPGYIGEVGRDSPTYAPDILLDLETVANTALGVGIRPPGWTLSISNNQAYAYLTLRRNLELLADVIIGVGVRPEGWQGANALDRCEPLVRNLVFTVRITYTTFTVDQVDVNAPDYCAQVFTTVNNFIENPPVLDVSAADLEQNRRFTAESDFAFSYLDVAATLYMGIMPGGTQFRAVYRNYGDSTMMFVTGSDFALYIDRRFTTMQETTFRALPTFNGAEPVSYCDSFWCSGPGPTPTPTGSSPLLQVILGTTPQPTPNTQELAAAKQLVSWNYIRVTYVSDDVAARTAQVTLEICPAPAADDVTCEPVISAFDNSVGLAKAVISQFNGLNVYEFRYGYTQNLLIEGATLYSQDLWISDPTIR